MCVKSLDSKDTDTLRPLLMLLFWILEMVSQLLTKTSSCNLQLLFQIGLFPWEFQHELRAKAWSFSSCMCCICTWINPKDSDFLQTELPLACICNRSPIWGSSTSWQSPSPAARNPHSCWWGGGNGGASFPPTEEPWQSRRITIATRLQGPESVPSNHPLRLRILLPPMSRFYCTLLNGWQRKHHSWSPGGKITFS